MLTEIQYAVVDKCFFIILQKMRFISYEEDLINNVEFSYFNKLFLKYGRIVNI